MDKIKIYITASILAIVLGLVLLIYMIVVEDEPTPIPPLLILSGVVIFIINRKKIW